MVSRSNKGEYGSCVTLSAVMIRGQSSCSSGFVCHKGEVQ